MIWVQSGIDASPKHIGRCSRRSAAIRKQALYQRNSRGNKRIEANHAKLALAFYEKSQDAEFEILEVFYSRQSTLRNPESKLRLFCRHVSFMAKPKNDDVSPKHFFGELVRDELGVEVGTCFTFEPSDYPGFDHGCILCLPVQKFHPAQGYGIGRFPWLNPKPIFRTRLL
ncbi:hypothetical protein M5689_011216 [Euphorbia peplus]|nr:hypothetical protein M5689_011216 [Euphorbia peplus]